jgi:hypothetical protein
MDDVALPENTQMMFLKNAMSMAPEGYGDLLDG